MRSHAVKLKVMPLHLLALLWLMTISNGTATAAEGLGRQALVTTALRVCADPANLPFSNKAGEGFENKIVELLAEKLNLELRYTWFPQSTGFVRRTLRIRECDLISGITTTSEKVQNTNPYYRSVYTLVYRKDSGINAVQLNDAQLSDKKIGLMAGTPPANIIASLGLLGNVKPYQLVADTRREKPARTAIFDVASGVTDVAIVWGPIAAYYARETGEELIVVPLVNEVDRVKMDYRVSMAVRYSETEWKHQINDLLAEAEPEIKEILNGYGVPLLDERGRLIEP